MDRFVILVDAGYFYAAAGELCYGTSQRGQLSLDAEKATQSLKQICITHSDQIHLRTYWYDAAENVMLTREQLEIAAQQGVKLRLGRLTKHGQKGVGSRIVRDLIVLPRNGAVSAIYLLSGDEDVREGVVEAQELGVSVVLMGIEAPPGRNNQAATLVREVDDIITLSRSQCSKFLSRAEPSRAGSVTPADDLYETSEIDLPDGAGYEDFGRSFGQIQRARLSADVLTRSLDGHPKIPASLDGRMLRAAASRLGDLEDQSDRHALRRGFWKGLRAESEPADERPVGRRAVPPVPAGGASDAVDDDSDPE